MPWSDGNAGGLNFVAFGKSFDAFEAQLKRMVGAEDGITDALFKFTRPVTGSYFWCPPMMKGRLDLRALGLYTQTEHNRSVMYRNPFAELLPA